MENSADHPDREFRPSFQISVPSFRYVQIAESLIQWIKAENLKPGNKLPPERDLSLKFGVNRATVRQALHLLQERGVINRKQGQGTFVAFQRIEREAGKLAPFTRSMIRKGYQIDARLISLKKIPADEAMANELQVGIAQPIFFIYRLRSVNREAVLLEKLFVPQIHFPGLDAYDLEKRSLYEVMETEYGIIVTSARQSLEAVIAKESESRLLGIRPGAPLMLERRLAFDQSGRPVERARDLFRGDRFRFVTELAPLE